MINKDFERDWKIYSGQVSLAWGKHWSVDIDKDHFGIALEVNAKFRLIYVKIGHIAVRIF